MVEKVVAMAWVLTRSAKAAMLRPALRMVAASCPSVPSSRIALVLGPSNAETRLEAFTLRMGPMFDRRDLAAAIRRGVNGNFGARSEERGTLRANGADRRWS